MLKKWNLDENPDLSYSSEYEDDDKEIQLLNEEVEEKQNMLYQGLDDHD